MGNHTRKLSNDFQIQISAYPTHPVPNHKLAEIGQYFLPQSTECKDSSLLNKWEKFLFTKNSHSIHSSLDNPKFRRNFVKMTRAGLPPSFRWEAWKLITQLHLRINETFYKDLPVPDTSTQESIKKDLGRTFPHHPYFSSNRYGYSGQKSLETVLFKLASKFPCLKYCQSLNFVAGFLLLANGGNDVEAFFMLEAILEDYDLFGFYTEDMVHIKRNVWVFQKLFEKEFPEVAVHFEQSGIYPEMWVFQWFMTLFTTLLKPSLLLTLWDLFLIDRLPFIYKISLAIIGTFKKKLIKMDTQEISSFLKGIGKHIEDEKRLVKYSRKFLITDKLLKKLEKKYKDPYAIEKAQSLEVSQLSFSLDISCRDDKSMDERYEHRRDKSYIHL